MPGGVKLFMSVPKGKTIGPTIDWPIVGMPYSDDGCGVARVFHKVGAPLPYIRR